MPMRRRVHAWAAILAVAAIAIGAAGSPAVLARAAGPATPAGAERFAIVPSASQVTYRVGETFFEDNRFNVAVGVTRGIQGDVYVDRAHPRQSRVGPITVDIRSFTSDSSRRDNAIRRYWLESDKYPTAVFTSTAVEGLPDAAYVNGREISVRITGNLKVRDVIKPATFTGTVKCDGDLLTGTLRTTIVMTDFGFQPPSFSLLRTENQAALEFQFMARKISG